MQKSREQHRQLLPSGLNTTNQHLFSIRVGDDKVGALWLAVDEHHATTTGFIYQLYIEEPFRRRGFAAQAMLALEETARALGADTFVLHVFAHNHPAIALYRKLGYEVTNMNMAKRLNGVPGEQVATEGEGG